jgi:hypothetical protein
VYKPLYDAGVSFCNAITNTRRDQENNAVAYHEQVTNALLREAIMELRAFRMAFMAAVSIRFYSRTETLLILTEPDWRDGRGWCGSPGSS